MLTYADEAGGGRVPASAAAAARAGGVAMTGGGAGGGGRGVNATQVPRRMLTYADADVC
jgi:hypothetical protein